jgi:hypothetical protein
MRVRSVILWLLNAIMACGCCLANSLAIRLAFGVHAMGDKAAEIGFDMIILPGGMTAVLQIMDQVFGVIKQDYTQRMAHARVVSSGRALDLQGRIKVWCQTMRSFKENLGPLERAARYNVEVKIPRYNTLRRRRGVRYVPHNARHVT